MLKFELPNADILKKKAKRIIRLKRERAKNQATYTVAFEKLLTDDTVKAIMALQGDEFQFQNDFPSKKINLTKKYGIKAGKYVQYFNSTGGGSASSSEDEDDFDVVETKPSTTASTLNLAIKERNKSIKAVNLVIDVMKTSDDVEEIYNTWVSQLIKLGESLLASEAIMNMADDDSDEPLEDEVDDTDDSDEEYEEDEEIA